MEDNSLIFGFENPSRSLCPITADPDNVKFLVTSQSPNKNDSVSLISYSEDDHQINRQIFKVPDNCGESWRIASSPKNETRFATTSSIVTECEKGYKQSWRCNIYQFDNENITYDNTTATIDLVQGIEFDNLLNCIWRPEEELNEAILLVSSSGMAVYENDNLVKICEKQRGLNGVAAWDPHHASRAVAAAAGHYVKCFDTRDKKETWSIGEGSNVKSIDFNPNKQNQLSIGGEDGEVRFYDVRNTKKTILKLSNLHTHWVWNVKYNPVHDQLFLSSGGDGRVYLHSVTSISSEPFGSLIENEVESKVEDGVILKLEEHDDAVYSCEWSTSNPWLFASLSYDGRLVINQVPKSIKYDILL